MNYQEYEGLLEHLEDLKELSSEIPIIVEGRNDEQALRSIGVEAEFHWVSSTPFHVFCDHLANHYDEVIIFTDLDRAGKELALRLRRTLNQRGVKVHDKHRSLIMGKLDTHHVEDIFKRFTRVEEGILGNGFWR